MWISNSDSSSNSRRTIYLACLLHCQIRCGLNTHPQRAPLTAPAHVQPPTDTGRKAIPARSHPASPPSLILHSQSIRKPCSALYKETGIRRGAGVCARLAEPHWHAGNYRHNVATLARSPGFTLKHRLSVNSFQQLTLEFSG